MSDLAHLLHRSVWLISSLTILLPGLAAAQVLDESQLIEERLPHIEQILTLQPLPETEVLIPDFQATFLSNGKVKLNGSGQARAGDPVTAIEFEVDLIQGTYRTRKVEPLEIAGSLLEAEGPSFLEKESADEPHGEKAVRPGNRAVTVKVQTRDPIFLVLTETSLTVNWNTASNGRVRMNQWKHACKAANPSALNTHWFTRSCRPGRVRTPAPTQVCQDVQASYYNDDFGFGHLRTSVSQSISMCGRNDAKLTYRWSHTDSGEWAILIFGWVIIG